MNNPVELLIRHGAIVLFVAVFVEQIGIPIPAAPWLLAAGALVFAGKMHWLIALKVSVLGSLVADMIWFYLGRHRGQRVVKLLCRISLEPDSCVRRTDDFITQRGMRGVVLAKFIPGLSTLVPALAGSSRVSTLRFLLFDALGAYLYVGTFLVVGVLFNHQLEQVLNALDSLGRGALVFLAALATIYIGLKLYRRQRVLHKLRMARITVDELNQKMTDGENLMILDLRSANALKEEPTLIRGALHMTIEEVEARTQEIPRDRDVILYCSCPNEASAAKAALFLHQKGIQRVRPLLGGIDAWRERNYPMELHVVIAEK